MSPSGSLISRAIPLPPSICFCDPTTQLIIPAQVDVIQVEAFKESLLLDLLSKIFDLPLDIPLTHVLRADQGSQRRLMLDVSLSRVTAACPPSPFV